MVAAAVVETKRVAFVSSARGLLYILIIISDATTDDVGGAIRADYWFDFK